MFENQPNAVTVPVKSTKAIVAAIGTTLTALSAALATVAVAVGDDKIDITEYASLAGALAALIGTIYAVWRVPNKPVTSENGVSSKM